MKLVRGRMKIGDLEAFLAEIRTISNETGSTVQCFDAQYVAGDRHLRRAVELAERAIEQETAIARDPAVEILLYAAGRRQINQALEMGVSEGVQSVVGVVTGDNETAASQQLKSYFEQSNSGDDQLDSDEPLNSDDRLSSADQLTCADETTLTTFFQISDAERSVVDEDLESIVIERVALLAVET